MKYEDIIKKTEKGYEVTCGKCKHEWVYTGKSWTAMCSSCRRVIYLKSDEE